jgi:glycosyltransferase involved in cell wall biosynthesis
METTKVVITTEGTYPYYTGGVSTWAHILLHEIENIEFNIIAIMMHPFISIKFDLPINVTKLINIPLWGTEEPMEYMSNIPFHKIFVRKLNTKYDASAIDEFKEFLETITLSVYSDNPNLNKMGDVIYNFHHYFLKHDYSTVFKSKQVWDFFYKLMLDVYKNKKEKPSIYDIVESLRWMYRFFISLLSPLPNADIYHSSAAAFCGLPCIVAKKKFNSKFLLTEHGVYVREQYFFVSRDRFPYLSKRFIMGLVGLVSKMNYYYADQISPVCAYNKRWEVKFGKANENKIKVLYNGIDTKRFRKMENVKRSDRPTIVTIARIDPLKDVETYIRVCSLLKKEMPDILCKIYGPPTSEEYYDKCKKLVSKLNVEDNFEFSGQTSKPETAINEADIFILTSISEAFPFVVLEAMACEKVVVASDVGGVKEVLEGYGFLIKPKDHKAFAEKILYLFNNKDILQEMSFAARERVLRGFRIEDMVRNYKRNYRHLKEAINEQPRG